VPCGPQIHLHLLQPTASADFSVYTHALKHTPHVEADTYKHTLELLLFPELLLFTIGLAFDEFTRTTNLAQNIPWDMFGLMF